MLLPIIFSALDCKTYALSCANYAGKASKKRSGVAKLTLGTCEINAASAVYLNVILYSIYVETKGLKLIVFMLLQIKENEWGGMGIFTFFIET